MMDTCWARAKRRGALQKFLAYALLSIACFLNPVHVWHVTVPGTLLVVTSLAYFLLSKQQKETTGNRQEEQPWGPARDEIAIDGEGTSSFHVNCNSLFGCLRNIFQGCRETSPFGASSNVLSTREQVNSEEAVEDIMLSVKDLEGQVEESTLDTTFILSPQM